MKTIYGVNIKTPINTKLKNGHTMYDWVVRKRCYPDFCMRTLFGEGKITAEEIEFLKSKGCKIGLVVNELTEKEISGVNATEPKQTSAPTEWASYCPSVMKTEDMSLWAYSSIAFDDIVAEDVYARDEKILVKML